MIATMPEIVVRAMLPEDRERFFDIRSLTYNDGNPYPEDRQVFKNVRPFVAVAEGEVAGITSVLDLTCTRGEAVLPCAGIAAVGVYPHRRKSGVGSAMMAGMVRQLRSEGIPMANLYAFREPFYRKAGYQTVGKRLKITCPTHRLPRTTHSLPIRRLTPDDWREIDPCYTAFAKARSGFSLRTEKLWERVLSENRPLTIYAAGDPVEAYVVVSHSTSFWSIDHMSDVAWTSAEGYQALMDIFAGIAINKTGLSWHEPSDSPFYARFWDQGATAEVARHVMYRVCDVPAALRLLRPEASGTFSIRVFDDIVPENEGPWRVSFDPEGVRVEPTDRADLEMDVRPFAQAFLGEPSLTELVRHELVKVNDRHGLAAAERLLPPSPVTCNDFF